MWSMPELNPTSNPLERIAFYGPMCSGKTFLADYLVKNHNYKKFSFATKLKSLCYELYGIDRKDGESRKILQAVGQQLRVHDKDVWIKATLTSMYTWALPNIVLDDLRYINEAQVLRNAGFTLILVDTPADVRRERVERLYPDTDFTLASAHDSEQEWKQIDYDFMLTGTGWESMFELGKMINAENSSDWETQTRERTSSKTPSTSA